MLRIKNGLEAWYQSTQTSGNLSLIDLSGKGRTITQNTTPPAIQANVQNGKQSIYFDGTKNPLSYSGSFTARHIFVVASFDDATFNASEYQGLVTDNNGVNGLLVGSPGTNKFTDFSFGSGYQYRKFDIGYASSNQLAPVSGQKAIMEISLTTGWSLDGVLIGRDRAFTARKWKGHFFEALFYSEIQGEFEKYEIYKHFGEEWHLWRQDANARNIFPFPAQHSRSVTKERKTWLSTPYDGDPVALVRGNSKKKFEFTAEARRPVEMQAADAFIEAHYPTTKWVYRDYSVYPSVDTTYRFTSHIKEQGSGSRLKSYAFQAEEA